MNRIIRGGLDEMKMYNQRAEELIADILNSPNTDFDIKGTKYYVAADGNDENDGLTPETAWQTIPGVNTKKLSYGDAVFFKRGDEFRSQEHLSTQKGVTYSAYGEGPKPKIIGSLNASSESDWTETDVKDIYVYKDAIAFPDKNVGLIIFDDGRAWGIHVQKLLSKDERLPNGKTSNGLETYEIPAGKFAEYADLKGDLEFWHDPTSGKVYLRSNGGHPAKRFNSVEISTRHHGIGGCGIDVTIDNIEIFGCACHGIGYGTVINLLVQNCSIRWIGGAIQALGIFGRDYGTRLGNAVESYGNSYNFVIRHNYASQIYDCCWTVQLLEHAIMNNIQMYDNVSEYCNTGLEVWQGGGVIENMHLHDNITRYNGYGWSHQRPNKDGNFFYGGTGITTTKYKNNSVDHNIGILTSQNALLVRYIGSQMYNFHDNIYFMEDDRDIGGICENPELGTGKFGQVAYNEENIQKICDMGAERGTTFYIVENQNMPGFER